MATKKAKTEQAADTCTASVEALQAELLKTNEQLIEAGEKLTQAQDEMAKTREESDRTIADLKERLLRKEKELNAVEADLEQKAAHLQFMVNGLNGDVARLTKERDELRDKVGKFTTPTFSQRISILFRGK